jgi:hypothetical protein
MQAIPILLVLTLMLVRVERDQDMFMQLLSLVGIKRRLSRSESTFALVVGGLVLLALFVAIDPEARIFLMFLDSVGADLFVTVCVLYLRHNLVLLVAVLLIPILKGIYRWGPVPGFWPNKLIIRSSVGWAGYAVVVPMVALFWVTLAALSIMAVLSAARDLLGSI